MNSTEKKTTIEQLECVLREYGWRVHYGNASLSVWDGDQCLASVDYPVGPQGPIETPVTRLAAYRSLLDQVHEVAS